MLPRSKSNCVTVDGERYRYIVSEAGETRDAVVPLVVTVQHEVNGARLRVTGLTTRRVPAEESRLYMGRTVKPNVEPRHVVRLIRIGLSRGWEPTFPGPMFILNVLKADMSSLLRSRQTQPNGG